MGERRLPGEGLAGPPVVGGVFVISPQGHQDGVRDFLKQHRFIEQIRDIVEGVPVIQIHGAAGRGEGDLRLGIQRGRIDIVVDIPEAVGFMRAGQQPAEIRGGAVGADCLDGLAAECLVVPAVVVVLRDGASHDQAVIREMVECADDLVFLLGLYRGEAEPGPVVVEERIEEEDKKGAKSEQYRAGQRKGTEKLPGGRSGAGSLHVGEFYLSHWITMVSLEPAAEKY